MSTAIQQNVFWFDIPMYNSLVMKGLQATNDLGGEESNGEIEKVDIKHFFYGNLSQKIGNH